MHLPFKVFCGFNIQFFWTLKSTPYAMKYDYKTSTNQSNTIPYTFAFRISIEDGENFFDWQKLNPKTGRTHISSDPKYLGTKIFLGLAFFWAMHYFRPNIFLHPNFLGAQKNVWKPKNFWEQIFLGSTDFGQNFFYLIFFYSKFFLSICWDKNFLDTTFF